MPIDDILKDYLDSCAHGNEIAERHGTALRLFCDWLNEYFNVTTKNKNCPVCGGTKETPDYVPDFGSQSGGSSSAVCQHQFHRL
jgi:hypothetical protein